MGERADGSRPGGTRQRDFIRQIVADDLAAGRVDSVVTRFPPEPNGYLHIGHAKGFALSFGVAEEFGGVYNLRFDDTNPMKEETEYVEAIQEDIRWLGFDWGDRLFFASDYFEQLHGFALELIRAGKAYVCSLSAEEMRAYRGTLKEPGRNSPYRERSVEENLELFERMRRGEFEDGAHVLRAKIDMASPNINMRDPTLYRIRKVAHHRTGSAWCIYPLYDFTHCLSDAIEGITHSLCSMEFEDNRALYDWVIDNVSAPSRPRQYEYSRLNLHNTVLSKRRLRVLVEQGLVEGWDDPRMPTLRGMRRRGYTPEAVRDFLERVGVTKNVNWAELGLLEECVRDDLNRRVPRAMCVLRPLKLVIENYPEGAREHFEVPNFPDDPPRMGSREVPFGRELWIERDDFMEDPPKKFFRLAPGREVRLRRAYLVRCTDVVRDERGEVVEVRCTYDPQTRGGDAPDGRKVRGTLHWVSAADAVPVEVRLYDRLFTHPKPDRAEDFLEHLNPGSLEVLSGCRAEPGLAAAEAGACFQFERQGYFTVDTKAHAAGQLVFNRTVPLRDTWAKIQKKEKQKQKQRR